MELDKLNLKEVEYYCNDLRCRADFDCLPFSSALIQILRIFGYYNIKIFSVQDLQIFYNIIKLKSSQTGKLKKYTDSQIANVLNKFDFIENKDNLYQIKSIDTDSYADEIKYGYEKGYIT